MTLHESSGPLAFGVTYSSLQAEGAAPASDWSVWERRGRAPRSGDGNGFATEHRADFDQLVAHGVGEVRLTIEWARIEPQLGRIDSTAVDRYRDMLRAGQEAGLDVWVTLQHQTLPGWFSQDEGGFADDRAREYLWAKHVDLCAETFGDVVKGWVPIDDPVGWAVRGYLLGSRPPGATDLSTALDMVAGALSASLVAARLLQSGTAPVMGVFGVPTIFAADPAAEDKARWWRDLFWHSWMSQVTSGELPLPDRAPRFNEEHAGAYDLIGLRFDHPIAINAQGRIEAYPADARRDDTGLAPWPEELGQMLRQVSEKLPGRPLALAAHGLSTTDEQWRADLLSSALDEVASARSDGVDLTAFHYDTGTDGYEGLYGFSTRRGLLTRDREPKPALERLRAAAVHSG